MSKTLSTLDQGHTGKYPQPASTTVILHETQFFPSEKTSTERWTQLNGGRVLLSFLSAGELKNMNFTQNDSVT